MSIEEIKTEVIVITGAPALDPVTVVFRDEGPARGGIIVECYGKAWSAFWGGMGSQNVREFVASCDADYLACKLWRDGDKRTKAAEVYLLRIATAIIASFGVKAKGGAMGTDQCQLTAVELSAAFAVEVAKMHIVPFGGWQGWQFAMSSMDAVLPYLEKRAFRIERLRLPAEYCVYIELSAGTYVKGCDVRLSRAACIALILAARAEKEAK